LEQKSNTFRALLEHSDNLRPGLDPGTGRWSYLEVEFEGDCHHQRTFTQRWAAVRHRSCPRDRPSECARRARKPPRAHPLAGRLSCARDGGGVAGRRQLSPNPSAQITHTW